jgi:hypothetical protein
VEVLSALVVCALSSSPQSECWRYLHPCNHMQTAPGHLSADQHTAHRPGMVVPGSVTGGVHALSRRSAAATSIPSNRCA